MMKAFFDSDDRRDALEMAAAKWVGTPFRHGSRVAGGGANCVGAVAGVLTDAGFMVPEYPQATTRWARDHKASLMEQWIDGRECFAKIGTEEPLEAGDVVGLKVGLCVHHLALVLPRGRFLMCAEGMGTIISSRAERQFAQRLMRVWRPVEP